MIVWISLAIELEDEQFCFSDIVSDLPDKIRSVGSSVCLALIASECLPNLFLDLLKIVYSR